MPAEAELHPLRSPAPPQPAIVLRLLAMLGGEASLPADCAKLVGLDAALVLWVMTTAAQSGHHRELPTVEQALQGLSPEGFKAYLLRQAYGLLFRRDSPLDHVQSWRLSIRCACLCERLALELTYPQPHEAYLAGLLHNFGPSIPAGWDLDHLKQARDAALADRIEAWRYPSLLPDALRYQHWPLSSLRDAASIVQILWASRSLVERNGRASQAEIEQLLGLQSERLDLLMAEAFERADSMLAHCLQADSANPDQHERTLELLDGLTRFSCLEQFRLALSSQTGDPNGVSSLARHLQEVHGLVHAIYLTLDSSHTRLIPQRLPGMAPPPALSIAVEGSDTAAAMAYQWHRPITAITVNQAEASLLDNQLARLAGREGVLAVPIGEPTPVGVLLACGYCEQLVTLGEDQDYLSKLARIAARHSPQPEKRQRAKEAAEQQGLFWQLRTRQLAHEINNPLGIIKNYLALLRVRLGGDTTLSDELRVIQEELDRIARIVEGMVSERPNTLEGGAVVDVNAMLADLARLAAAGPIQQKGLRIEQRYDHRLPPLRCHPDRLRQLLLNLLLNAMEAAPEQGFVSLETHSLVNHKLERQVEILISNTGPEMAPEVFAHLFEPVPSTKGEAHAGLGLSIVRSLASDLNATVSCRSQQGMTTFQVLLPVDQAEA